MRSASEKNRRQFLATIGVASAGAAFAGCVGGDSDETGDDEAGDEEATEGGHLNAGIQHEDMSSLDPALIERDVEMQVVVNLYDGLVKLNDQLEVEPDLAEDWEWESDTEVTFELREDVQFHTGGTMTAEDVQFSFERILDEETGSPWRAQLDVISDISVEDDTTVTFELEESFSPMEAVIVRRNMASCILSKEAVENGADPATEPVGTGPFQLETWDSGSHLELERFDEFWDADSIHLDGATVEFIPDATTLVTALEAGDLAMIDTVPSQDIDRLDGDPSIQVYETEGINVRYMGFNTREENVFSETALRQAASLAISRDDLIQVLGQEFEPLRSPVPKSIDWAHQDDLPMQSQDAEQAQDLLDEADESDPAITIITMNENPWQQMASVAQSAMEDVGFTVDIEAYESGAFWDRLEAGEFDAWVLGWTGLIDPDQYLFSQFTTDAEWNYGNYSNDELDDLLQEARRETDQDERAEMYGQAQEIISEDAVYACLASQRDFQASRDSVQGYEMPPTGTLRFENTYLD